MTDETQVEYRETPDGEPTAHFKYEGKAKIQISSTTGNRAVLEDVEPPLIQSMYNLDPMFVQYNQDWDSDIVFIDFLNEKAYHLEDGSFKEMIGEKGQAVLDIVREKKQSLAPAVPEETVYDILMKTKDKSLLDHEVLKKNVRSK
jgi:hypothetical protein